LPPFLATSCASSGSLNAGHHVHRDNPVRPQQKSRTFCLRWRRTAGTTSPVKIGPKPTGPARPRGGFDYYHESARHLLECIVEGRDPVVNVERGRHITEMMVGALRSVETGRRYEMTTRLTG
jgi:predicted dehydrogenase